MESESRNGRPLITVCGLGPGDQRYITNETLDLINTVPFRYVRTMQHPTAELVGGQSFDHLYDQAGTFADVYAAIVEELVAAAVQQGHVLYAVPGSPLVLENSVRRLLDEQEVDVELIPAMSFLDLAWARLKVDPVDDGVRLVDGHRFETEGAGQTGPLLVAHVHDRWVLSDIKLAVEEGPELPVTVLQGLGTKDETVFEVAWDDLDRRVNPDHLTSIYIPKLDDPVGSDLIATVELMQRLRNDCPWDQSQDHGSLRPHLLEETYEVLEALDAVVDAVSDDERDKAYVDLEEELGDLWFQILFHSRLAAEAGRFTISDVARTIREKLIVRHPHIFEDRDAQAEPISTQQWEQAKLGEKNRASILDGIPAALPALALAEKVLHRAAASSLNADLNQAHTVCSTRIGQFESEESVGRSLLAAVVLADHHGVCAETALRTAVNAAVAGFREHEANTDQNLATLPGWPFIGQALDDA